MPADPDPGVTVKVTIEFPSAFSTDAVFYRIGAEVRRSRTGTGLGLFIVRSIVKGHNGVISADSAGPERGATFTISLPLPTSAVPEGTAPQEVARV